MQYALYATIGVGEVSGTYLTQHKSITLRYIKQ